MIIIIVIIIGIINTSKEFYSIIYQEYLFKVSLNKKKKGKRLHYLRCGISLVNHGK